MINSEILNQLMRTTEEEQAFSDGVDSVDKSIYTTNGGNAIRAKKLIDIHEPIGLRTHPRFIHFPGHIHDFIEMVYMCSGETAHVFCGEEITMKEGELLLLGQNTYHEILPAGEHDIALNFIILPSFFDKTLEMLGAEDTPIKNFLISSLFDSKNQGYLHFKIADALPVQNLIENLILTLRQNAPNKQSIAQTTMALIFMQLLNYTDKLVYKSREDAAIMKIFRYIEENYRDGTLNDAAQLLHYDFYWLSHKIKNRTGKTYTEHLQEKRLSQAAFLLKSTSLSIEDISIAVGYENKSYFHRIFTEKFGITPRKYRNGI